MTIDKILNETELTFTLSVRLDTTTAPQLETELKASLDSVYSLILDFKELEYISLRRSACAALCPGGDE